MTLAKTRQISADAARRFLCQWHAFSSAMPELLSICAMRASTDAERANVVANLYSELGLDSDGVSHPELLKDLIQQATGESPDQATPTAATKLFIERLRTALLTCDPAFNAGIMRALEAVAYSILDVLKEILVKSGNEKLTSHAYITIHEAIEAQHIEHTEENISLYGANNDTVTAGHDLMMAEWEGFWRGAYNLLLDRA